MTDKKSVFINCPICKKSGHIKVPVDIVKANRTGLSTVTVDRRICDHTFLVYVDRNFNMRECEKIDYIQSPAIIAQVDKPREVIFCDEEITSIKSSFYPLMLTYTLRSFLNNQNTAIVLENEKDGLIPLYEKFLNYIFKDTFSIAFQIVPYDTYVTSKIRSKSNVVIQNVDILKDKYNILRDADFRVERGFIQKLYDGDFKKETIKNLKLEIENAFILAKAVKELIEEKKRLNLNKIIKYLKKEYSIDVNVRYTEFLIDIVKNYFKTEVKDLYKNIEFMKFKKLGS
jgi:hypothetical protein